MQRSEIALIAILILLILAGTGYQTYRGAPKTSEVIITHPGITPFGKLPAPISESKVSTSQVIETTPTVVPVDPFAQRVLVYFNTASLNQLDKLAGIGEKTAQKILLLRNQIGGFSTMDDLLKVEGIGEKKLEDILESFRTNPQLLFPRNTPVIRAPFMLVPTYPIQHDNVRKPENQKISINKATKEDLMQLSGIGESLADTILAARQKQGGFKTWANVDKVPGVGKSRMELLQQHFILP